MSTSTTRSNLYGSVSFARSSTRKSVVDISSVKRDLSAARKGFGEEFPLLCAKMGALSIPEVMVLDKVTGKLVPLLSKSDDEETFKEEKLPERISRRGSFAMKSVASRPSTPSTRSFSSESGHRPARAPPWLDPKTMEEPCPPPTPYVLVTFNDDEDGEEGGIKEFAAKGFQVDEAIIEALGICLQWYNEIYKIALHDCGITARLLECLAKCLNRAKNITDLAVERNPIPEQNYDVLLQYESGLKRLSLRQCGINDIGANKLAEVLKYRDPPHNQTLHELDLCENNIGDEGVASISNGLRTNRTLGDLALARNYIGDAGAAVLASIIMKFPLTTEELINRRKRNSEREFKRSLSLTKKLNEMRLKQLTNLHALTCERGRKLSDIEVDPEDIRKAKSEIDKELNVDQHPYIWDARPEGTDLWCVGNFSLKNIDLGYNKVGVVGAHKFLDAIEYQSKKKATEGIKDGEPGVLKIILQGNRIPLKCFELDKIQEILTVPLREQLPPKVQTPQLALVATKKGMPSTRHARYTLQKEESVTFKYNIKDTPRDDSGKKSAGIKSDGTKSGSSRTMKIKKKSKDTKKLSL